MSLAESLLRHGALALAVCALGASGLRLAAWAGARGLLALAAAVPVAAAAAVIEALALGLAGLGGDALALCAAAVATWVAARRRLPAPARVAPAGGAQPTTIVLAAALAGLWGAWTLWLVLHPAFGHDMLLYHLPEAIGWAQDGSPGTIEHVVTGLPVGNYPLTHEVLLSWGMAIGRSFVWATLVTAAMPLLAAVAGYAGLRELGVERPVAALAAAAVVATPGIVASQSGGASLDPAALAWLCCCGGLCAGVRREPRLLVPALVAGGLAIGTKTTAAPLTLVVLAVAVAAARGRLRPLARPLAAGFGAMLAVGSVWYIRNLVQHGSPLWPFVQGPWGDARPPLIAGADVSFLDRPGATVDRLGPYYVHRFGGPLVLLAGALLAPFVARRRAVVAAAVATAASIVLWLQAPFTGVVGEERFYDAGTGDATRYALPAVAAAALTLALASRHGGRTRTAVLAVLGAATLVGLWNTFGVGYPAAPSPLTPLAGALAAGVVAAALVRARLRRPRLPAWAVVAVVVVLGGAGGALAAPGYAERHGGTGGAQAGVARYLAGRGDWRDGSGVVASTFALIGPLAGDHLEHPLELIGPDESCERIGRRRAQGWVVLDRPAATVDAAGRCLARERPAYADGHYLVYGPP